MIACLLLSLEEAGQAVLRQISILIAVDQIDEMSDLAVRDDS
jgi:hypothetical protein